MQKEKHHHHHHDQFEQIDKQLFFSKQINSNLHLEWKRQIVCNSRFATFEKKRKKQKINKNKNKNKNKAKCQKVK